MRVADRPLPTVLLDPDACADWPVRPVIAVQQITQPPFAWDDAWATWDDPTPLVWDTAIINAEWIDATCDFTGLTIESGKPDDKGLFDPNRALFQLDNARGRWAEYNADGTASRYGPGQNIAIWAHNDEGDWWMFYGAVARWDELENDVVEVEAFDAFSDLAQPVGSYTPGVAGQLPGARLTAIVSDSRLSPAPRTRFAPGTVTLTRQVTDQSPLEEMQTITDSDGALLFGDTDGTVVSTDRNWRNGRLDQDEVPVISDNVCTSPFVLWDVQLSTNDAALADTVVLENIAKLQAIATHAPSRFTISDTAQQWTTQAEGDAVAAALLAAQIKRRVQVSEATIYLFDPKQPDLWTAVEWRLFDRLRFLHDTKTGTGTARLDVDVLLYSIDHELTAGGTWAMTIATTRSMAFHPTVLWDSIAVVWDGSDLWGF